MKRVSLITGNSSYIQDFIKILNKKYMKCLGRSKVGGTMDAFG